MTRMPPLPAPAPTTVCEPSDSSPPEPTSGGQLLPMLGLHGYAAIEPMILAALAVEEPLLLVGAHGTGKTTLAERLAAALGESFWAYDAAKAQFEDILGFPDPRGLAEGFVDYIPTPVSIWDKTFVLVDELSRAAPAMQNKWLEVIRSRRIMGKPADKLRYLVAAMNPARYAGAQPLDAALVGRFPFVVDVPDLGAMTQHDRLRVIGARRAAAGVGDLGALLACRLADIRRLRGSLLDNHGDFLARYIHELWAAMAEVERELDGRRAAMMPDAIAAIIAARRLQNGGLSAAHPGGEECLEALQGVLPWPAEEEPPAAPVLLAVHGAAWARAGGDELTPRPPARRLDHRIAALIKERDLDEDRLRPLIGKIEDALGDDGTHARATAVAAIVRLARAVGRREIEVSPDTQLRIFELHRAVHDTLQHGLASLRHVLAESAADAGGQRVDDLLQLRRAWYVLAAGNNRADIREVDAQRNALLAIAHEPESKEDHR